MEIGDKIKQLRIKLNLTQEELANRCELTKGFISQIERDLTSPSIATLVDILESLGSNLRDFFNDTLPDKIVFENADMFVQENESLGHRIKWIIPNAQKNVMEPIIIHIAEKGRSEIYSPHEGEVFGYVINGNIRIHIGSREYKAKKGESFYYKANASHYIENASSGESKVIWVSSPPNF